MDFRKKIRVLVVDDSILFRRVLTTRLPEDSDIEIVGAAVDAFDAKGAILRLKPDVVTLDVEMPGMSGIELLNIILPQYPVPVVLVSSLNISVFEALSAGAVDFEHKPDMSSPNGVDLFLNALKRKILVASVAKVHLTAAKPDVISTSDNALLNSPKLRSVVIAIGASTGGTEATLTVLKDMPANSPGTVVVQHMPEGFTAMYAKRLNGLCPMEVKEAENGDVIERGRILLAPGNSHMKVVKIGSSYTVRCYTAEKVNGHRPSVDVLFDSVAETVGNRGIGVIMTGMGGDGAKGLLNMRKKGAFTVGQDEKTCVVYGMPKVARDMGAVEAEAPCEGIAETLKRQLEKMAK